MLPRGVADRLMKILVGDLRRQFEGVLEIREYVAKMNDSGGMVDWNWVKWKKMNSKEGMMKKVPNVFRTYLNNRYSKVCKEHGRHLSSEHLAEHGVNLEIVESLESYQSTNREKRREIKIEVWKVIGKMKEIIIP